jgi:AcrR family transcriptional regulator
MASKGQATKDRIVKSALRLFHRQGYKQTTIDDICEASGVKRGNLFYYFDNKEEIAHAAISKALGKEKAYFDSIKNHDTDALSKVELMIDGMIEYAVQLGCKAC